MGRSALPLRSWMLCICTPTGHLPPCGPLATGWQMGWRCSRLCHTGSPLRPPVPLMRMRCPRPQVWSDVREEAEAAGAEIVKGHPGVRFYARCALTAGPTQGGDGCIGYL